MAVLARCAFFLAALLGTAAAVFGAKPVVVVEGCRVFDSVTGQMLAERTILIRGQTIARVAAPHETLEIPADATRLDGRGKFAIPGLIPDELISLDSLDQGRQVRRHSLRMA